MTFPVSLHTRLLDANFLSKCLPTSPAMSPPRHLDPTLMVPLLCAIVVVEIDEIAFF